MTIEEVVRKVLFDEHADVIREAVDQRGGDHGVAEDLASGLKAAVGGDDD